MPNVNKIKTWCRKSSRPLKIILLKYEWRLKATMQSEHMDEYVK